jgi:hypothetical protein
MHPHRVLSIALLDHSDTSAGLLCYSFTIATQGQRDANVSMARVVEWSWSLKHSQNAFENYGQTPIGLWNCLPHLGKRNPQVLRATGLSLPIHLLTSNSTWSSIGPHRVVSLIQASYVGVLIIFYSFTG